MAEDNWQKARLIPTSGINGQEEAERRATSALLAVLGAVPEFGAAVVRPLGAPGGLLNTFIEVPFKLGDKTVYPDGVLRTSRAGKQWTALVEVKTSDASLQVEQVECYLDVARENGFDAVLTISNQIEPAPGVHPIDVDRRKVKKVNLHHLSWAELLTIAVQQRVHRGVADPDQAWVLSELIRYLEHPKSGALDFSDMGQSWVTTREAVLAGTLRPNDKGLAEVVSRWEQLLRFAALRLGRELGADVRVALSRKEQSDPTLRMADQAGSLVSKGTLHGSLRIQDAVGVMSVVADLRAGRVTVSVDVEAPREGRPATRVNWLLRQLKEAPDGLRIEAWAMNARMSTSELLRVVRDNPSLLIEDAKKDLRLFRVSAASVLGTKRGTGKGAFIDSILSAFDGFYGVVVQGMRPWVARAPQLPSGVQTAAEAAGIDTTPPPGDLVDTDASGTFGADNAEAPEVPEASDTPPPLHDDGGAVALVQQLEGATDPGNELGGSEQSLDPPSDEAGDLMQWPQAEEKLDRERLQGPDG
jgi:hypothetical protein